MNDTIMQNANVNNCNTSRSAQVETEFHVEPLPVDYTSVTKSDFSKGHLCICIFQF